MPRDPNQEPAPEPARGLRRLIHGTPDSRVPWRALALVFGGVALLFLLWERCGVAGCPNVDRLASYQPGGATVLLDRDGVVFTDLRPVRRSIVSIESLPDHVPEAFIAVEDQRFRDHDGVDWRRIFGAVLANVKAVGIAEGFSTITMQLARNVFPDRLKAEEKTMRRKLLEVRVARDIEDRFTKDEILELYMNHIYFGGGTYGIEAAAYEYFGKPAEQLTLAEAAVLAAMPKAPNNYDPRRHPERARERRDLVLTLMAEQGRIDAGEAERARESELRTRRASGGGLVDRFAPYYADAVRRQLEDELGDEIYTRPLRVYTTIDRDVQRAAEAELAAQLRAIERGGYGRFAGRRYSADAEPDSTGTAYLQGAIVVLEARSGDVLALVGGRDYEQSAYDRATRARRQAGSAFKPFVFAEALEQGYAPSQRIADEPLRMELAGGEVWEPRNFTGEFEGAVTLRDAVVRSKNVPTIRLAAAVGLDEVADLAHESGIHSPIPELPSMAIGAGTVSPLELAAGYTAFATLGNAVEPRFVIRVEDENGDVVHENDVARERVLRPATAYLLTDMLREAVERGTGVAVRRAGFRGPAAGKTGTTNDAADVWFVGYTPDLVASVWIGFDQPDQIVERASGGRLAAPVWGGLMRRIYRTRERPGEWPRPDDVVELRVDPETGLVLAEGCRPERGSAREELFIEGLEPASTCPEGAERERGPGFFDRVGAWFRSVWSSIERWADRHFGEEKDLPPPERRDELLGAPRLPRADEIPTPELSPELYETTIDTVDLLGVPWETAPESVAPPVDTGVPVEPGDTVLILEPTDSGVVLDTAVVRED